MAKEDNLRNDLNSWAAFLETCDYSPNHSMLMERVIQTQQLITLRKPIDHADEVSVDRLCLAVCGFLAEQADGIYQIDDDGWYDAAGTLLLKANTKANGMWKYSANKWQPRKPQARKSAIPRLRFGLPFRENRLNGFGQITAMPASRRDNPDTATSRQVLRASCDLRPADCSHETEADCWPEAARSEVSKAFSSSAINV